uniref:Uncharacterized protein LOC114339609 n=1 Tax=Diabrotica virgifera virgifera TaxID=50390 RepID=A0A6P7GA97_DIAVI
MATSNNDYKIQVDKLEGPKDWEKWKWHVSMLLRAYALEDIVNGMRKCPEVTANSTSLEVEKHQQWLKDDAKAASLLAGTLGKTVVELVLTCTHASEIWDKLRARFERSSTQRLNMLIEAFFRVQRDQKEDISRHVAKLQKLFVDLNDELLKHDENVLSEKIIWIPSERRIVSSHDVRFKPDVTCSLRIFEVKAESVNQNQSECFSVHENSGEVKTGMNEIVQSEYMESAESASENQEVNREERSDDGVQESKRYNMR